MGRMRLDRFYNDRKNILMPKQGRQRGAESVDRIETRIPRGAQMSAREAAAMLEVHPLTVYKAIHEGRLTAVMIGHSYVVVADDKFFSFERLKAGRPSWRRKRAVSGE